MSFERPDMGVCVCRRDSRRDLGADLAPRARVLELPGGVPPARINIAVVEVRAR